MARTASCCAAQSCGEGKGAGGGVGSAGRAQCPMQVVAKAQKARGAMTSAAVEEGEGSLPPSPRP